MAEIITVREEEMSKELMKYHLLNLPFDAVIHHFTGPDQGEPHDHPFPFTGFILKGFYVEKRLKISNGLWESQCHIVRAEGDSYRVWADTVHKIVEVSEGGCWTLILPGKKVQEPGFFRRGEGHQMLKRFWNETEYKPNWGKIV